MPQWRFRLTRLKRILQHNKGDSMCSWIEPKKRQLNAQMVIGRGKQSHCTAKPSGDTCSRQAFWCDIATSQVRTIDGSIDKGNRSPKCIRKQPCPNAGCCWGRSLWGAKHDHRPACEMSSPSIPRRDWSHHQQYHRYVLCWEAAEESDLWYHCKWADAVPKEIHHLVDRAKWFVRGNCCSAAPENNRPAGNTFRTSNDASSDPSIRVNSVNGFWRQFDHQYFWHATNQRCEGGVSIYKQSQRDSTNAEEHWPVYQSWLYGRDAALSCPSRAVWYWLCKGFQPTIHCW